MGLVLGRTPGRETLCFSGKVAAAADEGQLVCEAVAAGVPLSCDWFLLGVLHCAVARVRVGIGCSGTRGCRSQCSGCVIVVILCCHVRRCMQVCHVMLQNALSRPHVCCMGLYGACVGEKVGGRNIVFWVEWLQPAMKGSSSVKRLRLGSLWRVIGSYRVFCTVRLLVCA